MILYLIYIFILVYTER